MSLLTLRKVMILERRKTLTNLRIPRDDRRKDYSFGMNREAISSNGTVAKKSIKNLVLRYSTAI